jgi:hypothetical protein
MGKFEMLDNMLRENKGFLKTSDAVEAGISRTYFGTYVRKRCLERAAHGLYKSPDAWNDGMYIIQVRFPEAVFSHETAAYLLNLAIREPVHYAVTMKSTTNATLLARQGVKVYKVKETLFGEGITKGHSPAGHMLNLYNQERTICDLFRSRRNIEIQDLQAAIREYVRLKKKNIPLLMRYAKLFSVEKIVRQYLEALL